MVWKVFTVVVLLVAGALAQPETSPGTDRVYIALGDSIAAGIGSSLPRDRSYPAILGGLIADNLEAPVSVENLAEPGESAASFPSSEQFAEFQSLMDNLRDSGTAIQLATLSLGGNEILDLQDASTDERAEALATFEETYPAALAAVVDAAGSDIPIYVTTIYDPTGGDSDVEFSDSWWIDQFNMVIRQSATDAGVTLVDLAAELGSDAADLTRYPIDVHPTNEGHQRIAAEHWQALGLDTEAPAIEVTSSAESLRWTPTLRFVTANDVDPDSIQVVVNEPSVVLHQPVEVRPFEHAALIDASTARPERIEVTIRAVDYAGNTAEESFELRFTLTR